MFAVYTSRVVAESVTIHQLCYLKCHSEPLMNINSRSSSICLLCIGGSKKSLAIEVAE